MPSQRRPNYFLILLPLAVLVVAGTPVVVRLLGERARGARMAARPSSGHVVSVAESGAVRINGTVLEARGGGRPPWGLVEPVQVPASRPAGDGPVHEAWVDKSLGLWVVTRAGSANEVPVVHQVRLTTRGMGANLADLVFSGVLELRGQRLDFSQPGRHGAETMRTAKVLNDRERVSWQQKPPIAILQGDGVMVSLVFTPEGEALDQVFVELGKE